MNTPRRDVAGHTLSNLCKKKGASIMVAAGLCVDLHGVDSTLRYRTCCARITIRGRRRAAVLPLSSSRTGPCLKELVALALCLVRCSVKLWRGHSLARFVPKRLRSVVFLEVSRRPGELNGRHEATRSHQQDPREDHRCPDQAYDHGISRVAVTSASLPTAASLR